MEPGRSPTSPGPGRARLSLLVLALPAPPRSRRSTTIWHLWVGGIVPTWQLLAPRRLAEMRRPAVRDSADQRMAEHRPDAALTSRLCRSRSGPGRAGLGLSQPRAQRCAGGAPESAHKHYSAIDLVPLRPITREELMQAVRGPWAPRPRLWRRPRLLRIPPLPRDTTQSAVELDPTVDACPPKSVR